MMDGNEIINFISNSKKSTPVKVYVKGEGLDQLTIDDSIQAFLESKSGVLFGEWNEVQRLLNDHQDVITDYVIENDRRNSAIPYLI